MNILTHLKNRLHQRGLRQQLNRAKTATPILDAVAEAAKLEGVSGDEIIADFISGKYQHPIISAVLSKPAPRPAPPARPAITKEMARKAQEELEKAHRAITGPKSGKSEDDFSISVRESLRRNRENAERERRQAEREKREQVAPPPPAKPAENLWPFENDGTQALVYCLRKKYFTGRKAQQAAEELVRRNVTIHAKGYSISKPKA